MDSDEDLDSLVGENGYSSSVLSDVHAEIFEVSMSPNQILQQNSRTHFKKYDSDLDDVDSSPNIYVSGDSDDDRNSDNLADDEIEDEINTKGMKKSPLLRKGYPTRCSSKWSPKIKSVCHKPRANVEATAKNGSGHLVLVKEDEIKKEQELLDENDDYPNPRNLQKAIFAEYPNLKIKDEFNFTSCSIKLEKMDFSHVSSVSVSPVISPVKRNRTRRSSKSMRSSRLKSQSRKSSAQKSRRVRPSRSNKVLRQGSRRSSRLKEKTLQSDDNQVHEKPFTSVSPNQTPSTLRKEVNSFEENESRQRAPFTVKFRSRSSVPSENNDILISTKSKKTVFMEANGLTDKKSALKSKVDKLSSSDKTKKVSFADLNGNCPELETTLAKKEKDPVEDYKVGIAKYLSEIDNYKQHLNAWYECLCCDRKYGVLEQCKEHVRSHFPGMLTN